MEHKGVKPNRITFLTMLSACATFSVMEEGKQLHVDIIDGYAQHGYAVEALKLAKQMQQHEVNMDHITFVSVLCACSHAGLVDEGYYLFYSVHRANHIRPTEEHYACMVDLLARAGRLQEAQELIREMPFKPCADVWRALLGACRIHGSFDLAKCAAKSVLMLEPQDTTAFVLLSNIYAAACSRKSKPGMNHARIMP